MNTFAFRERCYEAEARRLLGVSKPAIRKLVRDGFLSCRQINNGWRMYDRGEVVALAQRSTILSTERQRELTAAG